MYTPSFKHQNPQSPENAKVTACQFGVPRGLVSPVAVVSPLVSLTACPSVQGVKALGGGGGVGLPSSQELYVRVLPMYLLI